MFCKSINKHVFLSSYNLLTDLESTNEIRWNVRIVKRAANLHVRILIPNLRYRHLRLEKHRAYTHGIKKTTIAVQFKFKIQTRIRCCLRM